MQRTEEIDAELEDEIGACVRQLVPLLGPEQGEILTLVELEGLELPEAAARLGLTLTQVRVRLHRARASLRALLSLSCASCPHASCDRCACAGCAASSADHAGCH